MSCAWLDNINEGSFVVPFFICATCTYGQWSEPLNHKFLFAMVSNIILVRHHNMTLLCCMTSHCLCSFNVMQHNTNCKTIVSAPFKY